MKALKRVSYSADVDILMIQLSNKKVDDSYDGDNMIVQVDKNGEPVLLEIFQGKKFLKEIDSLIHKSHPSVVAHEIKLKNK